MLQEADLRVCEQPGTSPAFLMGSPWLAADGFSDGNSPAPGEMAAKMGMIVVGVSIWMSQGATSTSCEGPRTFCDGEEKSYLEVQSGVQERSLQCTEIPSFRCHIGPIQALGPGPCQALPAPQPQCLGVISSSVLAPQGCQLTAFSIMCTLRTPRLIYPLRVRSSETETCVLNYPAPRCLMASQT